MDFHGMERKELQSLCKKHGIPANLKTTEMANRLASLLEKETEEIDTETKDNNLLVKKVRFSPENEVFEFTRSVKKRRQRKVQQSGVAVRRSTQIASKGVTVGENELNTTSEIVVSGSNEEEEGRVLELIDLEQFEDVDVSKGLCGKNQGGFKFGEVKRRSTRLVAKGSKGLVEDEIVKDNGKEVSMDVEVQGTGKDQDPAGENVRRQSRRFVRETGVGTNAQDRRKSMRLKASVETKESNDRKTKQSKRSVAVNTQEGELVKNKRKEPLIDCVKVHDGSEVEKVPRRSKQLGNDVNLLMDKKSLVDENVNAVNHDDLEVEKSVNELLVVAPKAARKPKRTAGIDCEDKKLPRCSKRTAVDKMCGQATANSLKRRVGAADENVKKLNVNDEMQVRTRFTRNSSGNGLCKASVVVEGNLVGKKTDAATIKSSKVVASRMTRGRTAEPEIETETTFTQTSVTPEKLLEKHPQTEQQEASCFIVEARGFTKKSKTMSQQCINESYETKIAESVSITENVLDSTLEKVVDSSQRANTQELSSELMEGERDEQLERITDLMALNDENKEEVVSRSALLTGQVSPASVQLAATNPEAQLVVPTGHTLVKDTTSTLTCTPNSDLLQDNPLALADEAPSTETIATIPTMIPENVTVKVSSDISLVRIAQECDSELVDREYVEKNEQETVLMAATTEREEASMMSVSTVECSEVNTSANNRSAGDYLSEEPTPSNLETYLSIPISSPRTELKGHGSVANLEKLEVTLQNSAEYSYGNLFDGHSIAEEEMEISKVGCMGVVPCENETPQKISNVCTPLEPEEARDCLTEKEIKGSSKALGESVIFTTVKRNLLLIEQLSGEKICLTQSVTHHNGVEKSERKISSNALNLSGWFASPSPKEENVSECLEEEEVKAARNSLDDSAVFTTRERNLMVMEQVSENGMICAAQSVTHLNDEAVESHAIVLTTPEKVFLIGEFELGEVDKECGILNTEDLERKEAVKTAEKAAPEFHEKSANIPERQSIPEEFEVNEAAKSEKLRFDYGVFTSADKNLLLVTDEEMKKGDDISISSGHKLIKDFVSTPRTELKGYGSGANLAQVEVTLQNSAEIHLYRDDGKAPLENDLQAANSYENFFNEHSIAEEEMEISKVACMSVVSGENLTQQKLFDANTQLEPEEAWASNVEATSYSKKMKQEFEKEKPQGRAEDSLSTSETKVIEFTPKLSGNISLERNKQESSSELLEDQTEEKMEQDTVMMVVTKDKDIASVVVPEEDIIAKEERLVSISRSDLKEHTFVAKIAENEEGNLMVMEQLSQNGKICTANHNNEVVESDTVVFTTPNNRSAGDYLSEESTTPPTLVLPAMTNLEANLSIRRGQILVKDIVSTPRTEHGSVANLEKVEVTLQNSAEIHSNKDDENGSLEKDLQYEISYGNLFDEHSIAEEEMEISKVGCMRVVPCENKTPQKLLNAEEARECLEEKEMKIASKALDESAVFTTLERNLLLMKQLSDAKICAAQSATNHNDEASRIVFFTTPEKVLLMGEFELDEAAKEVVHTATKVSDESDVSEATNSDFMLGGSRNEARNEREGKNHDESDISTTPLTLSSIGSFKGDGMEKNEEKKSVELPCDSGICTSPDRLVGNLVSDGAEDSGGSHGIDRYDKSGLILTSSEKQLFYGDAEQKEAGKSEEKSVPEFHDEPTFPFLEDSEMNEAAKSEENEVVELRVDCDIFASEEKSLLLETDEEMKKGVNIFDKSHVVSDDVTAADRQCVLGDSEPDEAENEYRVETLSESNISTKLESHSLYRDSELDGTKNLRDNAAAKGNSCEELSIEDINETIGEVSSHIEVAGMVSGESCRSTDVENCLNDALEVLSMKGNNEVDELMEANVTKNIMLDLSGNSSVSEKTCVLARMEDEHLGFESEALEDEVTSPSATAYEEESISPTLDEFTIQNKSNEEVVADEEVIRRETTPALEDEATDPIATAFDEEVVRRELVSIYGTQMKPNGNDMKENAPNSKVVHNLNLTGPRMTKRKPLQDLRNN